MSLSGAFTFVLHSHLPYARLAGRWPHGEEWIHEALMETYVPLLETLYTLKDEGINFHLTLGITPVLGEQLADPDVLDHFDQYMRDRIAAADRDLLYFEQPETANETLRGLASWTKNFYVRVHDAFTTRFDRDVIGAFKRLQDAGCIEIMASAATHGYLPLLGHDSAINAQIKMGIRSYKRQFGRPPTAFWLPECGYRPAYFTESGLKRPGIERYLSDNDIHVFFSETHAITGGDPVAVAGGDVVRPYGGINRRYVLPVEQNAPPRSATTFASYWVSDTTDYPVSTSSTVAVIGRNVRAGQQVWSSQIGYPGDVDYREFYRKSGMSGIQYWRITDKLTPLGDKDTYHPEWASYKVDQHAEHFAHLVGDQLRQYRKQTGEFGLIAANFDTELFGHWWFEGVDWLGKVLRHLAQNPDVQMTTASDHVRDHAPTETLNLPESSWGVGGSHFVWDNHENHWMWQPIYDSEARIEALASRYTDPTLDEELVLQQAGRELMLMQSSDWGFLITTGQAREYASQRFNQHLDRFDKLAAALEANRVPVDTARDYYALDNLFPDLDYRWFRPYSS